MREKISLVMGLLLIAAAVGFGVMDGKLYEMITAMTGGVVLVVLSGGFKERGE